jgi:hypothetical protein
LETLFLKKKLYFSIDRELSHFLVMIASRVNIERNAFCIEEFDFSIDEGLKISWLYSR